MTPRRLNKRETFTVPIVDVVFGSVFVAGATILLSIMGGLFV